MIRLAFFVTLSFFLSMALLPRRISAFSQRAHPYLAGEQEFYSRQLAELKKLKSAGADSDSAHNAMLKVARSLACLRRYREADAVYKEVWSARSNSKATYDETFVRAVIGLAGLRRDMSNFGSSIACYSVVLDYDKKHLAENDSRLTRDKTNLGVALLIAGKCAAEPPRKRKLLNSSAAFLSQAIAEQRAREPHGSMAEANARQTLSYVLKELGFRQNYEKELQSARAMQLKNAAQRPCHEP